VPDVPVAALPPPAYTTSGNSRLPPGQAADVLGGIVALAADALISIDDAQRIALFNPAAEHIFGYAADEVLGRPLDLLLPRRHAARHRAEHVPGFAASSVAARRLGERRAVVGRRKSGEEFPAAVAISKMVVDGRLWYHAVVRDVSERTRHEDALRAGERRFRGIFDSTFHFIGLLAPDGTVLEANRAALDFAGVTAAEVVGRPYWETPWWAHSAEAQARLRDAIAAAAAGAFVRFETEHRGAHGVVVVVDFSLKPVRDDDGRVTLLVPEGHDVTEARRTAALLRESEETFRSAFEHSGIGMALAGLDGRWLRVNRALCRILGYEEGELLEHNFQEFTHAEDLSAARELLAETLAGERSWFELEKRYRHRDGRVVWARLNVSLVRGPADEPRFLVAQVQDVTERKAADAALEQHRAELARSNAELARSNDELARFAYVASHDLQAPLRAVASYTQLLAQRYGGQLDARAHRYIRHAVDGARRMQALIDDLLALARVGTHARPPAPTAMDAVLARVVASLAPTIAETGAVVTAAPLPVVLGDARQLEQLLANLLGNAIKFRRPEARAEVHVSAERAADGRWEFAVRDDGIGIDPANAEQIFAIFCRLYTEDEYPGTGMGLAICRKVVERHGGAIRVESAPGRGATFLFTLPAVP
jgi:PAS domain S-box-containing protein